jgi:hypothetical protein
VRRALGPGRAGYPLSPPGKPMGVSRAYRVRHRVCSACASERVVGQGRPGLSSLGGGGGALRHAPAGAGGRQRPPGPTGPGGLAPQSGPAAGAWQRGRAAGEDARAVRPASGRARPAGGRAACFNTPPRIGRAVPRRRTLVSAGSEPPTRLKERFQHGRLNRRGCRGAHRRLQTSRILFILAWLSALVRGSANISSVGV